MSTHVFVSHIIPYIRKFRTNPVTGTPLKETQLVTLHYHKNAQGEYHDPVTFKNFNDHSHIVAIRTSGNVYEYNTIKTLNIDVRNLRDLLTDQPFERSDIITLQDPQNIASKHDFSRFHHVKNNIKVTGEREAALAKDARFHIASSVASDVLLSKLQTADVLASSSSAAGAQGSPAAEARPSPSGSASASGSAPKLTPSFPSKVAAADNVSHFSTGRMAGSLTSTATSIVTNEERALYHTDDVMYERIKKKAYARIVTNVGNINVELFADMTPMTVHNFILLAKRGYYKNVPFHRSVKNFMIQGGDPTGTGSGGESAWGGVFKNEMPSHMSFDARGLLAMANRGLNTNGSQLYVGEFETLFASLCGIFLNDIVCSCFISCIYVLLPFFFSFSLTIFTLVSLRFARASTLTASIPFLARLSAAPTRSPRWRTSPPTPATALSYASFHANCKLISHCRPP